MILVTGAGGPTGRAVIGALRQRGMGVRALVHRQESATQLTTLASGSTPPATPGVATAIETIAGDFLDADTLAAACAGIERIYHICPNFHPAEAEIGAAIIHAARMAGVAHIFYHSVLHPAIGAMPHHWEKMRVEELLLTSDIPCTIVQPAVYMQNLRANLHWQMQAGARRLRLVLPYRPAARISLVHLGDVGEIAALLLAEEQESGGVYPLVGTPAWSQHEVAQKMSEVFGVDVVAEELPLDAWRESNSHLHGWKLNGLAQMFAWYDAHGLAGSTRILRRLLGREPTSLAQSLQEWSLPA